MTIETKLKIAGLLARMQKGALWIRDNQKNPKVSLGMKRYEGLVDELLSLGASPGLVKDIEIQYLFDGTWENYDPERELLGY